MEGLPFDSALSRAADPDRAGRNWTRQDDFLALIAELIDAQTRLLFQINTKKGTRPPDPIFIPRPFEKRERTTDPKALQLKLASLGIRVGRDN